MKNNETVIMMTEEKDSIVNMDLYSLIETFSRSFYPFVVCHVTDDEYKLMQNEIMHGSYLPERYSKETDYGYNKNRYLLGYNCVEKVIEIADYNHSCDKESKGRYYIANGILNYDESRYPFTSGYQHVFMQSCRIYTTKTFEDIIDYYKKNKIAIKANEFGTPTILISSEKPHFKRFCQADCTLEDNPNNPFANKIHFPIVMKINETDNQNFFSIY